MKLPNLIDKFQIPHKPGIYIYKDMSERVIYVGKAVDLFHRVSSYLSGRPHDLKTTQLVQNISRIETIIVESEIEALILEANLIKKYLPPYNVRLTDDKDYLYIAITKEEFPRIVTARKKDTKGVKKYFGPFPSSKTVKESLKSLRKVFPWCNSPPGPRNKAGRPCFYYHLGQCPGACIKVIDKSQYLKIISRFTKFLEGRKSELLEELTAEMETFARSKEFEKAGKTKKTIQDIMYITQPTSISRYLENPNFMEDFAKKALKDLQHDLKLSHVPERIEAYDISNLAGKQATGSMVVLINGEEDKSKYRRFKIRVSGKPNDVGMHKEMMERRLNNDWPLPQLIIIDGGRGQVRGSSEILKKKGLNIPIFGLAKRMEWIYPPEGEVVKLPKSSLSLKLLQKIRDESHRFAVSYHRKLRKLALGI